MIQSHGHTDPPDSANCAGEGAGSLAKYREWSGKQSRLTESKIILHACHTHKGMYLLSNMSMLLSH